VNWKIPIGVIAATFLATPGCGVKRPPLPPLDAEQPIQKKLRQRDSTLENEKKESGESFKKASSTKATEPTEP
jgi:hypothetical protein